MVGWDHSVCVMRCRESKRRRAASEFGMRSWWPERSGPGASSCLSFTASIFCRLAVVCCSTYSSLAAITPSHHTLLPIYSHGFPTIKPSPQTAPSNSSCNRHGAPPVKQRRIPSFPQQQIPNQRVCCDHQFTDRCSERESPTRPRSSPLRLDPQASPGSASACPAPSTAHSTPIGS